MDSEYSIISSMRSALTELGLEPRDDDAIRSIIGLGLVEAVRRLYPEAEAVEQTLLVEGYRRHFIAGGDTSQSLFPGVRATLERIAAQGAQMAVATGKGRRGLDKVLVDCDLGHFFMATRTADECYSKPHPQMLLEVMEIAAVAPERTLMIGDSVHDVGMANSAGVRVLGVSYGVQPAATLLAAGAMDCIDQISGVMDYIGQSGPPAGSS